MTLPSTMRHVVFTGPGGPEVIQLADAPVPHPGPGQVLIKVAAAGINRPDCLQRAGAYPPPPGESVIPGLEVAGEIVATGADTGALKRGDKVCALLGSGGYAEYALAAAPLCLPVPENLSMVEAAGLPETYFTVFDNMITRGRLEAGETVLIHGGSSGIGSTAIQLAKAFGARVIATAGSPEKCAFCKTLGADAAIDYRATDFVAATRAITGAAGVDVILDMVGGSYIPKNISLLGFEGRLVQIAFLQSPKVEQFDFMPVMLRRLTLTGSTMRPRSLALKAEIATALLSRVWPLLAQGKMRPIIYRQFPLAEAAAAHTLMETSAQMGKIMLVI